MPDISSILDITIHDEKKSEPIGCLSLPLLKIKSGEKKWYALKDSNLRDRAKGNNPRILLEMNLTWKLVSTLITLFYEKLNNTLPDPGTEPRISCLDFLSSSHSSLNLCPRRSSLPERVCSTDVTVEVNQRRLTRGNRRSGRGF